ncbi:carbamoyl phosphate synthase-like protein [Rubripirellula amarantea]|uniref:Carbamoyl phosphate synthase-like protein n=1 Tax=Rubripirellula amarantea TaxID=2527999 RepID=A0A5C5WW03_9BACT|nr:ATP-grasp domain-containing protein [Rubripirellula amarantea]TWT55134.1 carbamoyl phosphate synthase-like protein [Rubripirellula amarantea]
MMPTYVLIGASIRSAAQSIGLATDRDDTLAGDLTTIRAAKWVGIDMFGDLDTRRSLDEMHVVDPGNSKIRSQLIEISRLHPDSVWVIVGQWPHLAEQLAPIPRIETIPKPDAWRIATSHTALIEAANRSRLRVPETISVDQVFRTTSPEARWLVKSPSQSGGMGVRWFDGNVRLDASDDVLQQHIQGVPYGATFLRDRHQTICLGVCRSSFRRIASLPFVYSGSRGPFHEHPSIDFDRLNAAARAIGEQSQITGIFNVDFIVDKHRQHWLLEVNPRWSGSSEIIERGLAPHVGSLLSLHINVAMGAKIPTAVLEATSEPTGKFFKRVVFASQDSQFDLAEATELLRGRATLADIPEDGTIIQRGHPICTVVGNYRKGEGRAATVS